jgi:DNA-binding transcriptional LysR family regulator
MSASFDIECLRTMVVGIELGSFARAALHLGRSQSAVSMQLKKLEEQAGQPLLRRSGRGLVPTEAGDALLVYARRIIDLHDEAATSLGAAATTSSIRMGLPQDFFEDVMPETITRFSRQRPNVHIEVRAGRNYALEEEVRTGHLDLALAFVKPGADKNKERLKTLPLLWLAGKMATRSPDNAAPLPLVLFDHPCLFRQTAIQTLEIDARRWRLSLTTPSLPGVWAALRFGHGITVRTAHRIPSGIRDVGVELNLPRLPSLELRLLTGTELSPAASELADILKHVVREQVIVQEPTRYQ